MSSWCKIAPAKNLYCERKDWKSKISDKSNEDPPEIGRGAGNVEVAGHDVGLTIVPGLRRHQLLLHNINIKLESSIKNSRLDREKRNVKRYNVGIDEVGDLV